MKHYQQGEIRTDVLTGLDLELAHGELLAIVGSSGCGKSTFLHLAGALDKPTSGRVLINDSDIYQLSDKKLSQFRNRHIGFIYQFHHLLPEFSAAENIVLPQLANGTSQVEANARALDLLTRVGLGSRADHRPAALSGGEQQRVAFCRALANQPRILLADEPTGNLDPGTSDKVFAALMDLVADTGMTALIATHNLDLAARMDRTIRLENGILTD